MTSKEDISASVVEAFAARGFEFVTRSNHGFILVGPLHTSEGSHDCLISIPKNFDRPPVVILREIPEVLRPLSPHVANDGSICYLSRSSIEINIFDPVGQMLGCLERAEKVLGQLLRKELVEDLAEEFFAYWGLDFCHCFFDFRVGSTQKLRAMRDTRSNDQIAIVFITDDVQRTKAKSKLLGHEVMEIACPVARIRTRVEPLPSQDEWPLKTLGSLLRWQSLRDSRASRKIEERVIQAAERGDDCIMVMIESPKFFYAFGVFFGPLQGAQFSKAELRKRAVRHSCAIYPLHGWRVDEGYITQRNVPGMKTLENKTIIVIGCGTIGGYLADMLVKAGAGAGTGELILIDSDTLHASNLGRHRLGFPHIDKKKSDALAQELSTCMPDANIRSFPVDARSANLSKADLIIDATGEQPVSDFIASEHKTVAQLSVWIEGPGVAVRSHIKRNAIEACIQCLTRHMRERRHLATVEEMPKFYAGQGCENEYVPFPASVSMQAACLAAEMVMDWSAGTESPALRTLVTNRKFTAHSEDCSPPRSAGCPACSS
jgi:hypothetical protein